MAKDSLKYVLSADATALVKEMDAASKTVVGSLKQIQKQGDELRKTMKSALGFDLVREQMGKLASTLGEGDSAFGKLASTSASVASEVAAGWSKGGVVGLAIAGIGVGIRAIADEWMAVKRQAQEAQKIIQESVATSQKFIREQATEGAKYRADLEAINVARREGLTVEEAQQRLRIESLGAEVALKGAVIRRLEAQNDPNLKGHIRQAKQRQEEALAELKAIGDLMVAEEAKAKLLADRRAAEKAAEKRRADAAARAKQRAAEELAEAKRIAAAEEARQKAGESAIASLNRELALHGDVTAAAAARYDVEVGQYAALDEAHKKEIVRLAEQRDTQKALDVQRKESAQLAKDLEAAADEANAKRVAWDKELNQLTLDSLDASTRERVELEAKVLAWQHAYATGATGAAQYGQAVELLNAKIEALKEKSDVWIQAQEAMFSQLKDIASDAAGSMTDALVDGFFEPQKMEWGKWFADISKQIAKAIVKMLAMQALKAALAPVTGGASLLGFASGGYTGPGGKFQPAGIVHKGEGVLSQRDVAAMGGPSGFLSFLSGLRSMRGYASGGAVGSPAPAKSSGGGMGGVRIINNLDPSVMESALQSSEGQRIVINTISANSDAIRQALGV